VHHFKRKIAEHLNEPVIETDDLEEIFSYLAGRNERRGMVFDEFSYLVEKDDAIFSLFQVVVDETLRSTNTFFDSLWFERFDDGVLSSKSDLYERKTAHIKLSFMPFSSFYEFFPSNTTEKTSNFTQSLVECPFLFSFFFV